MKKSVINSLIAASILTFSSSVIFANDAPTSSLPMSTILQNLKKAGYPAIEKVKFDDGKYKVEAINAQGQEETVYVNAQSGLVEAKQAKAANKVTALDAAQKVEAAGYHNIYKIDSEEDSYEVKAIDKNGKEVKLKVNATSGAVSKD